MNKKKKHSLDFKLSCVKQITSGRRSVVSIAREFSLPHSMVRRWYKQFKQFGKEGLTPRKCKIAYGTSFKIMVLQTIREENLSLDEAILRFNLSTPSMIVRWKKRLEEHGIEGLMPQPKGRPLMDKNDKLPIKRKKRKSDIPLTREEELLKENEYLRAENALLKKLQALAQENNRRKL